MRGNLLLSRPPYPTGHRANRTLLPAGRRVGYTAARAAATASSATAHSSIARSS